MKSWYLSILYKKYLKPEKHRSVQDWNFKYIISKYKKNSLTQKFYNNGVVGHREPVTVPAEKIKYQTAASFNPVMRIRINLEDENADPGGKKSPKMCHKVQKTLRENKKVILKFRIYFIKSKTGYQYC